MFRNRAQKHGQRSVRPARRVTVLAAAAAGGGAVLQYLLDPASGRARRARVADKAGAAARRSASRAAGEAATKAQVARDKAVGTARGVVSGSGPPPTDQALADKIRSEVLGTEEFRDFTINVDSADGHVALRGQVKHPEQVKALEQAVQEVEGVRSVRNLVHLPGTDPENIRAPMEASRGGRGPKPS